MALQNLINVGVSAADVIMLGGVGETALSGASLAGQVQYIMTLFLFGLTSGATVLTAQYWGKGDRDSIEKILGMAVKAAVFVTALFIQKKRTTSNGSAFYKFFNHIASC